MNGTYRHILSALRRDYDEGEARAMAFLLLEDAFGIGRTEVYADKVRDFTPNEAARLEDMLARLHEGEPAQYVVGRARFCGRYFSVTPATLIPRPETEELVGLVLADATTPPRTLLDVGTGSGCIAISLKLARPEADVEAWDISGAALDVARQNALALGADVDFAQRDMTKAPSQLLQQGELEGGFVVSNPPYVMEREGAEMAHHVMDYEPHEALFVPDDDALRYYRALARLGSYGRATAIYCEINAVLGKETAQTFRAAGYADVSVLRDDWGRERFVRARGFSD